MQESTATNTLGSPPESPNPDYFACFDARFIVEMKDECASTNSLLLQLAEQGAPRGQALVARRQTAGRGRRGRAWYSHPEDSLTFSVLWRFSPARLLLGLSLAVGVGLIRALHEVGAGETASPEAGTAISGALTLKWPNDILLGGKKLAGILVELVPGAAHSAVIGIGLNRRLPKELPPEIRAGAAAWPLATPAPTLLSCILRQLGSVFDEFEQGGFAAVHGEWQRANAYKDAQIMLLSDFAEPRQGICRGTDRDGALLFETSQGVERVLSGEVSLRAGTP